MLCSHKINRLPRDVTYVPHYVKIPGTYLMTISENTIIIIVYSPNLKTVVAAIIIIVTIIPSKNDDLC